MTLRTGAPAAAILLAAGASRRMGTVKALLPCPPHGEPLVRRVALALTRGGAVPLLVVVAPGEAGEAVAEAVGGLGAQVIINPAPERGMLSSVQAGLNGLLDRRLPPSGFLVCPCDLPRLEPRHVAVVLQAELAGASIIAPTYAGKRGHPTLFPAKLAPEILTLDPETVGLNLVLKRHADLVVEVEMADDAVLRDADTPEEWRELMAAVPGNNDGVRRVNEHNENGSTQGRQLI